MMDLFDARNTVVRSIAVAETEQVPFGQTAGRILAGAIVSQRDLPAWDNSAMDGFALCNADLVEGRTLPVIGFVPAGQVPQMQLQAGQAVRVMTGAPVPQGTEAVLPIEEVEVDGDQIRILRPCRPGANVRRKGEDVTAGQTVLRAGIRLQGGAMALVAATGLETLPVVRKPRVAILSTGDELVRPGTVPGPGQLIDCNGAALAASVAALGAEPVMLGIAHDDQAETLAKIREGLEADLLITTAGVSTGDRDFVRECLQSLSAEILFSKVNIKPGKPTTFALCQGTPVFCLPGNPVAALMTFEALARPAILKSAGHSQVLPFTLRARFKGELRKKPGRLQLARVMIEQTPEGWVAGSAGNQATGMLHSLAVANGLMILPTEQGDLSEGQMVDCWLL